MAKDEKYYVPDISEFHVGFEYQVRDLSGEWINHVFDISNTHRVHKWMNDNYVRVKHLDHDDILECGWESKLNINMVKGYRLKKFSLDWFNDREIMIYNEESERLFCGHLRNKSELKKLMVQLGIK